MTGTQLSTGVTASRALLPPPPQYWSYSTLKAVKECPRRYALERSTYPDLWTGRGYPPLPNAAALFGNVVHDSLEAVVKALTTARVESAHSAEASSVLRELGGLTSVIETLARKYISTLGSNPRLNHDQRERIARLLRDRTPDARARVQTYLSRTRFVPKAGYGSEAVRSVGNNDPQPRVALSDGSHAEARIVAEDLRLHGRVDLLTVSGREVEILDYKTGVETDGHRDQLRFYGLLWSADRQTNPRQLPVTKLTASYPDADVSVDVPTGAELEVFASGLKSDVLLADRELLADVPRAVPNDANCTRCGVRQLCSVYWESLAPNTSEIQDGAWFDCDALIGKEHAARSRWLLSKGGKVTLLLRMPAGQSFAEGDHVRFLGLRLDIDPETGTRIASFTVVTEAFLLTPT